MIWLLELKRLLNYLRINSLQGYGFKGLALILPHQLIRGGLTEKKKDEVAPCKSKTPLGAIRQNWLLT